MRKTSINSQVLVFKGYKGSFASLASEEMVKLILVKRSPLVSHLENKNHSNCAILQKLSRVLQSCSLVTFGNHSKIFMIGGCYQAKRVSLLSVAYLHLTHQGCRVEIHVLWNSFTFSIGSYPLKKPFSDPQKNVFILFLSFGNTSHISPETIEHVTGPHVDRKKK